MYELIAGHNEIQDTGVIAIVTSLHNLKRLYVRNSLS